MKYEEMFHKSRNILKGIEMSGFEMKSGISPAQKYCHELDPNDPADRNEILARTFGRESNGKAYSEDRGLLSPWSLKHGKTPAHVIQSHLASIRKYESLEAADAERDRIREIQRKAGQKITV